MSSDSQAVLLLAVAQALSLTVATNSDASTTTIPATSTATATSTCEQPSLHQSCTFAKERLCHIVADEPEHWDSCLERKCSFDNRKIDKVKQGYSLYYGYSIMVCYCMLK